MEAIDTASLLIRLGIGSVMVLFGISQQKSPQNWLGYIPGLVRFILPIKPEQFMRIHSLGNIALGSLLISGAWPTVSVCLALGWWLWVLPFAFYKDFTIGMRDLAIVMSLAALLALQQV